MLEEIPLTHQPETEIEYWHAIESLGGMRWRINHDLSHGRIPKDREDEAIKTELRLGATSNRLVGELFEKFGVVHPKDCPSVGFGQKNVPKAPLGMKWYWEWYQDWKETAEAIRYESEICSACPYSGGMSSSHVNCTLFPGMINRLHPDFYGCAMVKDFAPFHEDFYTLEELFQKIEAEHGPEARRRFFVKMESIRLLIQTDEKGSK